MVQTWDFAQKRCWVPPYHHPPTWFLGKDLMSTHQPGISKGNDKHRSFFEIFEPANRDLFFLGPGFWGKNVQVCVRFRNHHATEEETNTWPVTMENVNLKSDPIMHITRSFHLVGNPVFGGLPPSAARSFPATRQAT